MATSGTITYGMNARDLCTFALRKIGVVDPAGPVAHEDAETALENLNLMLKGWQTTGPNLWRQTEGTVTLTPATQSYVLSPRPYRVIDARYRDAGGRDMPMEMLTRNEYFDLPLKSASGIPTSYYFDPQRSNGTLYVWPVLSAVTTQTIRYTYQRVFEDVTSLSQDIDIPQEWLETVGYALAARLMEDFGAERPMVLRRSEQLLAVARDADREPVVRFYPGRG